MKILLLTLALGLVCTQEDTPSEDGAPVVLESLHTFYLAASNPDVIRKNEPMRAFVRRAEQSQDGKTFRAIFYTKDNGECHLHNVLGRLKEDGITYTANYAGTVDFQAIPLSNNFLMMSGINVNEEGRRSTVIGVVGTGDKVSEEHYQKFLEVAAENHIPEDNIIRVFESDTCPEDTI